MLREDAEGADESGGGSPARDVQRCSHWNARALVEYKALETFICDKQRKARCVVFEDLWQAGHWLSSGDKFGVDFLLYQDDPRTVHSSLLVLVRSAEDASLRAIDIVGYGRLATQVNKSVLVASVSAESAISYVTVDWAPQLSSSRSYSSDAGS